MPLESLITGFGCQCFTKEQPPRGGQIYKFEITSIFAIDFRDGVTGKMLFQANWIGGDYEVDFFFMVASGRTIIMLV